jgi:ribonuclease R
MADCARLLLARLAERGALDLNVPELKIELDGHGQPVDVHPATRHFAHRIIEVFMITANEVIADLLLKAGAPGVFRVHPPPDAEKIQAFSRVAASLGAPASFREPAPSPRRLANYLEGLRGQPAEGPLNLLLLRSLMQARYAPECEGHFGLASDRYLHFTSPIRRYPDLVTHRQLNALLDRAGPDGIVQPGALERPEAWPLNRDQCDRAAQRSSRAERRALAAERAASNLCQVTFMQEHLGEVFDGTVTFVMDFGVFVRIHPYGVEGLVHISRMREDYYRYDDQRMMLVGRRTGKSYRIGMGVRVRVDSADLSRREMDLSFVGNG